MLFEVPSGSKRLSIHTLFLLVVSAFVCLQFRLVWWVDTGPPPTEGDADDRARATTKSTNNHHKETQDISKRQLFNDHPNDDNEPMEFFGDENVRVASDPTAVARALDGLPDWIVRYVHWHRGVRKRYPGMSLLEHPDAPSVLIRTCFGVCGGLNDRLGQLPWDLHLANQTGRVLLVHWHRPAPLEHWFHPHVIDWRVPVDMPDMFPVGHGGRAVVQAHMFRARNRVPNLFDGTTKPDKPDESFFTDNLDPALERARAPDAPKVLRHRMLGHLHEYLLEERLRALGETDMIHTTKTFGRIFELFFQPSRRVEAKFRALRLPENHDYTAVHCRVRHPKIGRPGGNAKADQRGLPWKGDDRIEAIRTANHAIQCAARQQQQRQPQRDEDPITTTIYLLADSADLVDYYVHALSENATFRQQQQQAASTSTSSSHAEERLAATLADTGHSGLRFVAQPDVHETETFHLDLQKGHAVESYDGTFVDFAALTRARCLVLGVGNFAWLAAKISQTPCVRLHQPEAWGSVARKLERVPSCEELRLE